MDIDVHNIIPFVYENKKISYVYFKWQPVPVFLPGESQGRGAWWAAVYGVAESDPTEVTQQQQQHTLMKNSWAVKGDNLSIFMDNTIK